LCNPVLPIGDGLVGRYLLQYFDLLRRFQELKSVAVDRDAPFVASRARVSDVVCSFGSTLEQAKDGWNSVTATEATT
jgi:hypothetical protein